MDKIAVIMNDEIKIDSFIDGAIISLYENKGASWFVSKSILVCINFRMELSLVRKEIQKLIAELDDCKIIVGKSISGLAYQMFDQMGFDIFEIDEFSPTIFDKIIFDIKISSVSKDDSTIPLIPMETNIPGVYFLDLITLQQQNPEVSSKMALQPFLTSTPFLQLDVNCVHLPLWIEKFVTEKGMELKSENMINGEIQASITKIGC